MIDDRVCIYYMIDRIEGIKSDDGLAELRDELLRNLGVNARHKHKNPDALVADLPPIKSAKKGRPRKKKYFDSYEEFQEAVNKLQTNG